MSFEVTSVLQDRKKQLLDGRTEKNKGKLILTEIFPSVQKHDIKSIDNQASQAKMYTKRRPK